MKNKINLYVSISTYKSHDDAMICALLAKSKLSKYFNLFIRLSLAEDNIDYKKYNEFFDNIIHIPCPDTGNINTIKHENNVPGLRLFHSIIESGKDAINKKYDYIIYLNSGSWIFSDKGIIRIISQIEDKIFASRVLKFSNMKMFGCEDHFLIINLKNAKKYNIFDFSPLSRIYSPIDYVYGGVHKILFIWYSYFPIGTFYAYSDLTNSIDQYGTNLFNSILPFNWDYENFFMHSNARNKNIYKLRYEYINKYANELLNNNIGDLIKSWNNGKYIIVDNNLQAIYYKKGIRQIIRKLLISFDKFYLRNWGYLQKIKTDKIF